MSDESAIERVRAGEVEYFDVVYFNHRGPVFGRIYDLVHDPVVANELTGRTFSAAFMNLDSFDATQPVRPWVMRIAANQAYQYFRDCRRQSVTVSLEGELEYSEPTCSGPEASFAQARVRAELDRALAQLPKHEAETVRMHYYDRMSHDEIAAVTGTQACTQYSYLSRGLARMRRILEPGKEELFHDRRLMAGLNTTTWVARGTDECKESAA